MMCNALGALLAEEFNEQAFVWLGYAPARVVGWRANAPGDEKAARQGTYVLVYGDGVPW